MTGPQIPSSGGAPYIGAQGEGLPPQDGQPEVPQPGLPQPTDAPENPFTGFSIGAVVALVGSIISIASYPLVWYAAKDDADATITGFGTTHSTAEWEVTFHSSKLHWAVLAAGIVMIIVVVARLIGKYGPDWVRPTMIVGVIGVAGAILSAVLIDSEFKLGIGMYLALLGSVVSLAGGAIIALAKK